MSYEHRDQAGRRAALRCFALLAMLLPTACAGLDRDDQGRLQPQTVRGPCQVKKFFLLGYRAVPTDMVIGNTGEACRFTLFDLNQQVTLTAALVTVAAAHGRAAVSLPVAGRQAEIAYTPQPGYAGPDRFTVTLEPGALGVSVAVTVQPTPPS